jgi:Uma2 family endonuclease
VNEVRRIDEAPQPVKLTVDAFLLLAEAGSFDHLPKKVELLDGVITVMSPQLRRHSFVVTQLAFRLQDKLVGIGSPLKAMIGGTLTSRPHNAPEPDIFLTADTHSEGYAAAAEAPLVVEVSQTTSRHDLGRKRHIYAEAAIPEYWVFDIPKARVHRHWSPRNGDYAERDHVAVPGRLPSVLIAELEVDTSGLI